MNFICKWKKGIMVIDSFEIDKKNSYFNINELVIVLSFFKTQCNDALIMFIEVEMSINDITYYNYLLILITFVTLLILKGVLPPIS
jgi:hypothetical protein